jgi:hypothetical protein
LKRFHDRLQLDSEYAEKAQIVQGVYGATHQQTGQPTAFGVLLKEHAPKKREAAHVDETVLERANLSDRTALEREVTESLKAEGQGRK